MVAGIGNQKVVMNYAQNLLFQNGAQLENFLGA